MVAWFCWATFFCLTERRDSYTRPIRCCPAHVDGQPVLFFTTYTRPIRVARPCWTGNPIFSEGDPKIFGRITPDPKAPNSPPRIWCLFFFLAIWVMIPLCEMFSRIRFFKKKWPIASLWVAFFWNFLKINILYLFR